MSARSSGSAFDPLVLSVMTAPDAGFEARVEAAAAAGYRGIGLRPGDRRRAHDAGHSDADLRAMLAAHALEVVEIDVLVGWGADDVAVAKAQGHEPRIYELVDALGGRHLTVTGDLEGPDDLVVERFAGLCDRAAEHGLSVALEFLPWTEVPDAGRAWSIVEAAGRANGGVLIDAWHHFRGADDESLLRAVPADRILAVQFDDGRLSDGPPTEAETFERALPGEGEFDLVRFLRLLADHGVVAPLCVEVISTEMRTAPTAEAARRSAETTRDVLARAFPAAVG